MRYIDSPHLAYIVEELEKVGARIIPVVGRNPTVDVTLELESKFPEVFVRLEASSNFLFFWETHKTLKEVFNLVGTLKYRDKEENPTTILNKLIEMRALNESL